MFDIGFWEILLIAAITLIVVGPKRLPEVASKIGKFVSKVNSLINKFKDDISEEIKTEELKKNLSKHAESSGINEIKDNMKNNFDEIKKARDELLEDANPQELKELQEQLNKKK